MRPTTAFNATTFHARAALVVMALSLCSPAAVAQGTALQALGSISKQDQTTALRSALTQGAQAAVAQLGKPDGFLGNPKVRIPLPGKLAKADKMLRKLGLARRATHWSTR